MRTHLLVVAKAPVPGFSKTRLAATVGDREAAELAADALVDTLSAGAEAFSATCRHVALTGSLDDGVQTTRLRAALRGWTVRPQRGTSFAERLVNAHRDLPGGVVQIGMDTPQVTAADLRTAASGLASHDAVLGPATDGGWWLLALRDPAHAVALLDVPMSQPDTGAVTRTMLERIGLDVGTTTTLTDVDTAADAAHVVEEAPGTRFARRWTAPSRSAR